MPARGVRGPVVALSGTPGTGKSSVAARLRARGLAVLELARYATDARFGRGADADRPGTLIVDEAALDAHLADHLATEAGLDAAYDAPVFLDSHFAHELDIADRVLVLRCAPSVLRERLAARGWSEAKLRENLEAEALDLIVQEALARRDERPADTPLHVGEIDTTRLDVDAVAALVVRLATAEPTNLEIGTVDWSGEVLGWF